MNPLDVLIPKDGEELPDEDVIYYAATQNGWIINTPTLFGNAQTLSKEHPNVLPAVKERFLLNERKMPLHMLSQFHDFAAQNFEKNHAECSAYLTYNQETDDWRLFIPEQYVSHTSVNHKLDPGQIKNGYQAVGTIHSHCDFDAFHSGTDKHDMGKMPGLHITIGHVNTMDPDFDFALSVADAAFSVQYDQIIDVERPLDENGYATAPGHWLNFVKKGQAPWGYGSGVRTTYSKHQSKKPYRYGYGQGYTAPNRSHGKHWSDWDDDDYSWYTQTGTIQQHLFVGQKDNADAFKEHADEIAGSEQRLESEALHLALKGFALGFNITYNPKRAEEYLNKQGIYYSVGDDTPLLPELSNDSDSASK